jgi:hypothetical protein
MKRSIVVYDVGSDEEERFDVDVERFGTRRAAQRDANKFGNGKVIGFIPLNLGDPAIQALTSVVDLAYNADMERDKPAELLVLRLLRDVFLAGRASVK